MKLAWPNQIALTKMIGVSGLGNNSFVLLETFISHMEAIVLKMWELDILLLCCRCHTTCSGGVVINYIFEWWCMLLVMFIVVVVVHVFVVVVVLVRALAVE